MSSAAIAGGLQPLGAVALGQPQDAEAGAVALLGVGRLAQDDLDERGGARADLAGRRLALRRPLGVAPVARRHVLAHRRVLGRGRPHDGRRRARRGGTARPCAP